jgi:VWFA-related protein
MGKMMGKKILFYCFIFALAFVHLNLSARPDQKIVQQQKQEIQRPAYEVEVTVTNVDVVVTDKDGIRVTGLKPENFEIYEDNLRMRLTNFYEVKSLEVYAPLPEPEKEVPPPPSRPLPIASPQFKNKIIFYFDNWHLHPMNRNWSIKKLETFIQNNFTPQNKSNEGMVVCLSQKLEILQEFTSNQRVLLAALDIAKKRSGQSLLRARTKEDMKRELNRMVSEFRRGDNRYEAFGQAMNYAKNYVEAENNDLSYSLKSLSAFIDHITGVKGKKMLIYVSDGLPLNPGEEIYGYIDNAFPTGNARAEAMNYDATYIFKELTARCNASEITLYPINAKGLEATVLTADKGAGWDTYSRGSGMMRATSRVQNDALKLMANETGGVSILNTNAIAAGLEKIKDDLQFYYSLGYVSPDKVEGKYHSIEVKLVGIAEKYNVRVRHGYMRVSHEEKIRESVYSRLFLQRPENPMDVMAIVMSVEPMSTSKKLCLNLKILIPIKNLTFYSQGDEYIGKIKVYIALKDTQDNFSPCHELTEDIRIPARDYEVALRRSYPYVAEMYVDPGYYTISLAVKDVTGSVVNYLQLERTIE